MIFLDANILLRALTRSSDPLVQRMNEIAGDLLRRAERRDVDVTTSDAVIAEVAFILTSRAHYQLDAGDAAARIATIVRVRGFKLRHKRVVLQAPHLWTAHPQLGFVDALTASYAQESGIELATFDRDFDQLSGITRWQPDGDPSTRSSGYPRFPMLLSATLACLVDRSESVRPMTRNTMRADGVISSTDSR